ncbi:heterokaryon incompatibility protein-domain-containing protein [Xylaria castorea]|nr:heterokaryon incompatibility protein-domain-containing protein [Xylaria castorea]
MRLIQCHTLQLQEFFGSQAPPYAILSHTWQGEEVTFAEFSRGAPTGTGADTEGWKKITQTCKLAIAQGYEYVWIDACCIDKSSSAELTEAINSMYAWYADSGICFAYLSDFDSSRSGSSNTSKQFSLSRWFFRGWTLQELIAPERLEFYDSSWTLYGSKASLCADIAYMTGIDENVLCAAGPALRDLLALIPVCQKMSWAAGRVTQRPEDIAYSLLGIFGVHMPLIYGEGTNSFVRLQKEIIESTNDLTLLAWKAPERVFPVHVPPSEYFSVLAPSPEYFAESKDIVLSQLLLYSPDFSITNKGLQITTALPTLDRPKRTIMSLHCHREGRPREPLGIYLWDIGGNIYSRVLPNVIPVETETEMSVKTPIFLRTQPGHGNISNSALLRGHHFVFKSSHHSAMGKSIRPLSTYPDERWVENFGFRARDRLSFIGVKTYQASWQNKKASFIVACGFDPAHEPWACISGEGSNLWYAAMYRNYMRVGELAQKFPRNEIMLENNMLLSIALKPVWEERSVQVFMHADRKRRRRRTMSTHGRAHRHPGFTDRSIQYSTEPVSDKGALDSDLTALDFA